MGIACQRDHADPSPLTNTNTLERGGSFRLEARALLGRCGSTSGGVEEQSKCYYSLLFSYYIATWLACITDVAMPGELALQKELGGSEWKQNRNGLDLRALNNKRAFVVTQ